MSILSACRQACRASLRFSIHQARNNMYLCYVGRLFVIRITNINNNNKKNSTYSNNSNTSNNSNNSNNSNSNSKTKYFYYNY